MARPPSHKTGRRSQWAQGLRFFLLALLAGGAALLLGLAGTTLRTGWIAPLDWLLPGTAALILVQLLARREDGANRWRCAAWTWALVALPAGAFCLLASGARPWAAVMALAVALGVVALASGLALRLAAPARWLALMALAGAATLAPALTGIWRGADDPRAARPVIGVMTAVPLQGVPLGAVQGVSAAEAIGMRSPLWQELEARFQPRALDALDAASLEGLAAMLLLQPRRLAPAELVALDRWVRGGGRLVALADPLLHWDDARPLGHPARAPLTSLLDPLLTHWGLGLEPAEMGGAEASPERRWLKNGGMIQLFGASRFVAQGGGDCELRDNGLIADCRLGQGFALLIADADWVNDSLWTLNAADPADRTAWTSDAVDVLDGWLRGAPPRLMAEGSWLADHDALLQALRTALGLLLALAVLQWLVAARPTQISPETGGKVDQNRNKSTTEWDFT